MGIFLSGLTDRVEQDPSDLVRRVGLFPQSANLRPRQDPALIDIGAILEGRFQGAVLLEDFVGRRGQDRLDSDRPKLSLDRLDLVQDFAGRVVFLPSGLALDHRQAVVAYERDVQVVPGAIAFPCNLDPQPHVPNLQRILVSLDHTPEELLEPSTGEEPCGILMNLAAKIRVQSEEVDECTASRFRRRAELTPGYSTAPLSCLLTLVVLQYEQVFRLHVLRDVSSTIPPEIGRAHV